MESFLVCRIYIFLKELDWIEAPGRYFGTYGNWELGINTETGVVYHARMLN